MIRLPSWRGPAWAMAVLDLLLVALAWWVAFWLRFNLEIPPEFEELAQYARCRSL